MCASFEINGQVRKPGQTISSRSNSGLVQNTWAGFARNEILQWWLRKGAVELDIFASRFAERSDLSRTLIWEDLPAGQVIRGLLIPHPVTTSDPRTRVIKIVTRASTPDELSRFEHPRMPLLDYPLYGPIPGILPRIAPKEEAQMELLWPD